MAKRTQDGDLWASATWEGAARSTLLAGARLSLREKLAWLEQMSRLARHLRRPLVTGSSDQAPRR